MKNYLTPILGLALASCVSNDTYLECDAPALRAQYNAAVQKAVAVPVCFHTVYPDEATRDFEEGQAENPNNFYPSAVLDDTNVYMAGGGTDVRNGVDTKIAFYEFALRDIIVETSFEDSPALPMSEAVQAMADIAVANNIEGCLDVYLLQNVGLSSMSSTGFTSLPSNSAEDSFVAYWGEDGLYFPHELGHALGLLHTFETWYAGSSLDYPDEPYNSGDMLADTTPDPGTDYCHLESEGDDDPIGVCSSPYEEYSAALPIWNSMSYYGLSFGNFTSEQTERMHCTWDLYKDNIFQ